MNNRTLLLKSQVHILGKYQYKHLLMIGVDDIGVIPVKKVWRKTPVIQANPFSLPVQRKTVINLQWKKLSAKEEIFPMDQWLMPPQPQGYLKCADHDFL